MTPEGMPIDLPTLFPEGTPLVPMGERELVLTRAYHTHVDLLRSIWTEASLRDHWLELRREARLIIMHITPACVQATVADGVYSVSIEACFHEEADLTHLRLRFRPVEPVTTGLLVASGFVDLWEERLYRIADILLDEASHPQSITENP